MAKRQPRGVLCQWVMRMAEGSNEHEQYYNAWSPLVLQLHRTRSGSNGRNFGFLVSPMRAYWHPAYRHRLYVGLRAWCEMAAGNLYHAPMRPWTLARDGRGVRRYPTRFGMCSGRGLSVASSASDARLLHLLGKRLARGFLACYAASIDFARQQVKMPTRDRSL